MVVVDTLHALIVHISFIILLCRQNCCGSMWLFVHTKLYLFNSYVTQRTHVIKSKIETAYIELKGANVIGNNLCVVCFIVNRKYKFKFISSVLLILAGKWNVITTYSPNVMNFRVLSCFDEISMFR